MLWITSVSTCNCPKENWATRLMHVAPITSLNRYIIHNCPESYKYVRDGNISLAAQNLHTYMSTI